MAVFQPIINVWWDIFGVTLTWGLEHLYALFSAVGAFRVVGSYGLAIIALTIAVRLILFPLFAWQLKVSRKSAQDQRKIAPELAALRKKHKGNAQKLNQEMMKLYKDHGISPAGPLLGCLPVLIQLPVLSALYYVLRKEATAHSAFHIAGAGFLWVPNLNIYPSHTSVLGPLHLPALLAGMVPGWAYIVLPLLAAATTLVQSRMMMPAPNPMASPEEQQTQQMTRNMQVLTPIMIYYFAVVTPAGLGLYWFISNLVSIGMQYAVFGKGGLAAISMATPSPALANASVPGGIGQPASPGGRSSGSARPSRKAQEALRSGRARKRRRDPNDIVR